MDAQKVDMYIIANAKYFATETLIQIRERLVAIDDTKWISIQMVPLKDPQTSLLVSIFAGHFGVDRFIIGDTGLGIAKLLTCGGFGIWTLVDWFMIQNATREKNLFNLQKALY